MWTKIILAGTFQGNVLATPMGSIAASWASTRSCPPMSAAWGGGTSSLCVLWLVIVESIRFPLIMRETCCSLFTLLGLVCARVWNLLLVCNKWTDSTLCRWSRIISILYLKKTAWNVWLYHKYTKTADTRYAEVCSFYIQVKPQL